MKKTMYANIRKGNSNVGGYALEGMKLVLLIFSSLNGFFLIFPEICNLNFWLCVKFLYCEKWRCFISVRNRVSSV